MTRRREKLTAIKPAHTGPVSPWAQRMDLSDVASKHRVTNATTTEPLSMVREWAGCTHRPGSLVAFTLPSFGIRC